MKAKSSENSTMLFLFFAFIVVIVLVTLSVNFIALNTTKPSTETSSSSSSDEIYPKVSINVMNKNSETRTYDTDFMENETIETLMQRIAATDDFTYELEPSGDSFIITSINGEEIAPFNQWVVLINGVDSSVGINQYTLQKGDQIIFKITNIRLDSNV